MPHIRIELNRPADDALDREIARRVETLFAEIMDTGSDHVAISVGHYPVAGLSLGRVADPGEGIALIDADIRAGRSLEQRRRLALGLMDIVHTLTGIPAAHMYVTFTEHAGADFHLAERYLADWGQGDRPLD